MKKKILIILTAIFIGGVLAISVLPFNMPLKKNNEETFNVYILQAGVYVNYQNALNAKAKLEGSIIYQDNNLYRVLVGASTKEENLLKIETALQEKNIRYYKKEIQVLEKEGDLFSKYNVMLEKAENKETILLLNQKILEKMVSV